MTTAQNKLPVLDSLPIAYFVNGDTGAKKTTKQAWDKKVIYAEEIAVIVPIPEAVLDDADYDIWGEVKPRVQEAFGKVIDAAILFGDGKPTNWRDGLVPSAKTAGASVVMGNDLFTDLLGEGGVISKVEESGFFVNGHVADISLGQAAWTEGPERSPALPELHAAVRQLQPGRLCHLLPA